MNSIFNYIIQSGACFIIFFLIYFLLLKKETCFNYRRGYLLASSLLALSLPFVNFYFFLDFKLWQEAATIPIIQLPEITILSEKPSLVDKQFQLTLTNAFIVFYFIGVGFFLFRFLIQLYAIRRIIAKNRYNIKFWEGCNLINTNGKLPTFSFFNYLFWDNTIPLNEVEKNQILKHELVHIRQLHSVDVFYYQILSIILWFNPVIYWYKNAATDVHEYIADHKATVTADANQYSKLLVRQLFKSMDLTLGSYFNKSQTMRRLEMLKARNKRYNLLKILLTLPIIILMTVIMGFSIQKNPIHKTLSRLNLKYPPINDNSSYRNLLNPNPENSVFKSYDGIIQDPGLSDKNTDDAPPGITDQDGESLSPTSNLEIENLDDLKVEVAENDVFDYIEGEIEDNHEVFTIVEEQPTPIGGMEAFYKTIKKELKYPTEARKNEIEGKVFVQFVINSLGEITEVSTIKGIGFGCDEEAARVIQLAPKWNPGLQRGRAVKVRMVIPVTFKLQ